MPIIPNIIPIEEDELLYSYLLRLSAANGSSDVRKFISFYFKKNTISGARLYPLHYDTKGLYCSAYNLALSYFYDNAIDTILKSSMLPFYLPLLTDRKQGRLINYLFKNYSESKLTASPNYLVKRIRICPKCYENEKTKYIHRAHQISGVTVCHIHGCSLVEFKSSRGYGFNNDNSLGDVVLAPGKNAVSYARFCKDFMDASFDVSCKELKVAVLKRIDELGYKGNTKYDSIAEDMRKAGFNSELCDATPRFMRESFLDGLHSSIPILVSLLMFLFNDVATLKIYLPPTEDYLPKLLEKMGNEYEFGGEYHSNIVYLKHKLCGQDYFVSPRFFIDGWTCPCTYSDDNTLMEKIVRDSTEDDYILVGPVKSSGIKVAITHKTCGQTIHIKPSSFLYEGVRCQCHFSNAANAIAELGDFKLLEYHGINNTARILHISKGHSFYSNYHAFLYYPSCRICRPPRIKTHAAFVSAVADLVGDEYKVVGQYLSMRTRVKIYHAKCGKTHEYHPRLFLDGTRCPYCNCAIPAFEFYRLVESLSLGRYKVLSRVSSKNYDILDCETGKHITLTKLKTLQELTRVTPSPILQQRGKTQNSYCKELSARNHPLYDGEEVDLGESTEENE